jgi:hypothetical protein
MIFTIQNVPKLYWYCWATIDMISYFTIYSEIREISVAYFTVFYSYPYNKSLYNDHKAVYRVWKVVVISAWGQEQGNVISPVVISYLKFKVSNQGTKFVQLEHEIYHRITSSYLTYSKWFQSYRPGDLIISPGCCDSHKPRAAITQGVASFIFWIWRLHYRYVILYIIYRPSTWGIRRLNITLSDNTSVMKDFAETASLQVYKIG